SPFSFNCLGTKCSLAIYFFSTSVYPAMDSNSIRSNKGPGILVTLLAVAMNKTLDKSYVSSMKWSLKLKFCSGSNTSSIAEAGSPRKSFAILSSSSNKNTGLIVSAFFIPLIFSQALLQYKFYDVHEFQLHHAPRQEKLVRNFCQQNGQWIWPVMFYPHLAGRLNIKLAL